MLITIGSNRRLFQRAAGHQLPPVHKLYLESDRPEPPPNLSGETDAPCATTVPQTSPEASGASPKPARAGGGGLEP